MTHKQLNAKKTASIGKHPDRPSHPALPSGRVGYDREPSDRSAGGFSATARRFILPPLVTAVTALAAVTVSAAVAAGTPDPTALIPVLGPVATAVASLAGGITAGLCYRERATAASLVWGGCLAAILCLAGFCAGWGGAAASLTRLMPLPICGMGGFLTGRRKKKAGHYTKYPK